jgi:hypothetical protein
MSSFVLFSVQSVFREKYVSFVHKPLATTYLMKNKKTTSPVIFVSRIGGSEVVAFCSRLAIKIMYKK